MHELSFQQMIKNQRNQLNECLTNAPLIFSFSASPPSGISMLEWCNELTKRILNAGKDEKAEFLITSPEIYSIFLQSCESFEKIELIDPNDFGALMLNGVYLKHYLAIYVDPFFPVDQVLLGRGDLSNLENLEIKSPNKIKITNLLDIH